MHRMGDVESVTETAIWKDRIGHLIGVIAAAAAVAGASYVLRLSQALGPSALLGVTSVSALVLAGAAFVVFRRVVRRDYRRNRRLTPLPAFLQLLIWGLLIAFPSIYNPPDWAWTRSGVSREIPVLGVLGWVCVGLGLAMTAGAMAWLGLPRSFGQAGATLESAGPYRVSRNPQLLGGAPLILGYVLLWPSWYSVLWFALFVALSHMTVLSEEEHLARTHGDQYEQYCRCVPRYLGRRGDPDSSPSS